MRLFLDDVRLPPDGWTLVKTVEEAQALLQSGVVTHLSLDHDLGLEDPCASCVESDADLCFDVGTGAVVCVCNCHKLRKTGYDLVLWCAETDTWTPNRPMVHSANVVGAANMRSVINRYWSQIK